MKPSPKGGHYVVGHYSAEKLQLGRCTHRVQVAPVAEPGEVLRFA